MAAFPPKDKTVDRRPSLSGVLMQDVAHGVERSRAWPRKRGKKLDPVTKDQNDLFRQYQWATKYWDPKLYIQAMLAVKGTPLLPRDIMTMIMSGRLCAVMGVNGRNLYPMAALRDVSESLDVITQTPGQSIIRGDEVWEPYTPGGGGGVGWFKVHDAPIANPTAFVDVDVSAWTELMIFGMDIPLSASGFRVIRLSTDGGATFWSSTGDYVFFSDTGQPQTTSRAISHGSSASGARTIAGNLIAINRPDIPKLGREIGGGRQTLFIASEDPITHVRLAPTAGNMTGGRFIVLGR